MPTLMRTVNIHVKHDYSRGGLDDFRYSAHNPRMNIENLRRLRGLNQSDLAEMAQLSQPAISRAEKGDDGVTLRNYRKISAALNVPLADLFQEDRTKSENELLEMYRQLPADRQVLWLEMSRTFGKDHQLPNGETRRTARSS
jgi:transcriptional regulator with XRE-family HTH domain